MERAGQIRDVIRAAVEFHERRLWTRFTNFDCFGVRLAGVDDLFVASVMGDAGEQYGLMLFRGPHAADNFAAITAGDGPGDDTDEAMDLLAFNMEAFGELGPEAQAFFRQAGMHPRYDDPVPNLMVKPPNRRVRLPDENELALWLTVLKAAVLADRKKLLTPARLDDEDGICVIRPTGEPAALAVEVTREKLPPRPAPARGPVSAASGLDLSGLELLDATWLVGTPAMPGGIGDDDRSMQLLLVADDDNDLMLQAKPFFSEDIQGAVDALVATFQGHQPEGRRGIAKTILFSNRRLHDAVNGALEKAGAECVYLPTIPRLQEIAVEFLAYLKANVPSADEVPRDEREDDAVPAPDDLAGWKEADHRLSRRFAEHLFKGERLHSSRAIKRYFGDDDIDYFFEKHEQHGVAMAFSAWGMLDYRPTKASKTQAEKMLEKPLPRAEELLLRARMEAHPTVYRVGGHDPKAGTVLLEDVLLGGAVTVHDQLLSENVTINVFLVCRTFPAGRFHFIEVAGPPLGSGMGMEAIEYLRDSDLEFTPEGLKRDAHKFGWLWDWVDQWEADWQPPQLCNTDGDDLLFHTASFSVADQAAVRDILLRRKDVDYDEDEDEFIWSKAGGKGAEMLDGPVTLGGIEFVGDELVLTVNSAERFAAAREWLTKLPGVSFCGVTTRSVEETMEDSRPDETISPSAPVEITPEMAAGLQEMFDQRYMDWIDTPLPVLDGQTPRQACRTPAGRQQVTTLIRTIPDPVGNAPITVPRRAMLLEIGLEAEAEATAPRPSAPSWPVEIYERRREDADDDFAGPVDPIVNESPKIGRNAPCPCGSGRKYKKCCGR